MKVLRIFSQVFDHLQNPKESWTFPEICGHKGFFFYLWEVSLRLGHLMVFFWSKKLCLNRILKDHIEEYLRLEGYCPVEPLHKAGSARGVPCVGTEYPRVWKIHVQPLSPHKWQSFVLCEQWPCTLCCVSKSLCLNRQLLTSAWRLSPGLCHVSVQDNLQDWDPSLCFLLCLALCLVCHLQRVNCVRLSHNCGYCDYNKAVV